MAINVAVDARSRPRYMQEYLRWAFLDNAFAQPGLVLPDRWSSVALLTGEKSETVGGSAEGSLVQPDCLETSNVWYHSPQVVVYSCIDRPRLDCRTFYFEVKIKSIRAEDNQNVQILIGLAIYLDHFQRENLLYSNRGNICLFNGKWNMETQIATNLGSYGPGDTIGCGLCGNMCFFTRNGLCLGLRPLNLSVAHAFKPVLVLCNGSRGYCSVHTGANFGTSVFVFDASGLFSHFHQRGLMKLKDVAQRLPQELFMQIAERLLEAVGSERYTSVLSGMALVCRAWDQLCRPRRLQLVRILWMADFKRSCDIFAQSSARTSLVKTLQVGPIDTPLSGTDKAPSLELLLSSALVYSMRNIQTISWNALDLGSASPMAGVTLQCPVPPRIHAALPALLRPLAQLTTLRISNKTFKSLGLLLRALHAPRALHTLILENVRVPPLVGQLRWPISGWSTLRRIELRRSFVPIEAVGMIVQLVFSPQELLAHLNTTLQSANDQPTMPEQIITVVAKIFRVLVASYFTNQNGVSLDITTMPACEQGMPGVCTDFTLLDVHQSEQKVLLKCSLYISSAHVPVRSNRTLIRVTSTFYRGFAPTPLVEDHSFRTLLMDLDSTIFGFAETYTRELRIATDLQCILRFHGLYHVRVDELRTAIPQLMPQIGSRGRIQVGSAAPSTSGSTVAKSAAKSPVLPSSLVQRIIDHLDAHHSLHTASLVCRSWVPLASPHLLRRVTLYCTKRLDWSMRYDKREQTWHWHQGFFKLADQSARLRRHVREIAIAISSSPIPTSVIGCIISTFSHLEYLYLPGNIHPTSGPPMAATPVKFCGTLHLSRCSTLTLLASILPGLSSVRCLHLTQTYQGSRHVMPQLVPFSMASIQELILQDICDIHLLFGLPPTAFKKLTLIGVQDWAVSVRTVLNYLLLKCDRSLVSLSINPGCKVFGSGWVCPLYWPTALEHLELTIPAERLLEGYADSTSDKRPPEDLWTSQLAQAVYNSRYILKGCEACEQLESITLDFSAPDGGGDQLTLRHLLRSPEFRECVVAQLQLPAGLNGMVVFK